jgi:hypothetical protein
MMSYPRCRHAEEERLALWAGGISDGGTKISSALIHNVANSCSSGAQPLKRSLFLFLNKSSSFSSSGVTRQGVVLTDLQSLGDCQ